MGDGGRGGRWEKESGRRKNDERGGWRDRRTMDYEETEGEGGTMVEGGTVGETNGGRGRDSGRRTEGERRDSGRSNTSLR